MKRSMLFGATAAAAAALVLGGGWVGGASATATRTIRIDAVAKQENFVDVAPSGPSLGDEFVIGDEWKTPGGRHVGHDGVVCTATSIRSNGDLELLCVVTGHLPAGDITAQGIFTEPANEPPGGGGVFAVTGGTGDYSQAAGYADVQEVSEEETNYTFHLTLP